MLSQWKIFDNLRRSLVAPSLVALLLLGWTVLAPAWWWTLATFGVLLAAPLIASLVDVLHKPSEVPLAQHLAFTARIAARHGLQILFSIAWLPHEAFYSAAEILRTHWRLVTRRRLLEWTPSSETNRGDRDTLAASFRSMWAGPAIAVAAAAYLESARPVALVVAAPVLLLWLVSPALAWRVSLPRAPRAFRVAAEQMVFLRKMARRTWAYFEHFVGPADHWLPPDNFQEAPAALVAHRTSPTNMGLALLADLAAYDFGYLSAGRLIERTGKALQTMESLERHDGHFYNWYDTQSLQPLAPRYVSTVDSGNLAGHLLTLRVGFTGLPDDRIVELRLFAGMIDTARLLVESLTPHVPPPVAELRRQLDSAYDARPVSAEAARRWLERLAASIAAAAMEIAHRDTPNDVALVADETRMWIEALDVQCQAALDELTLFAPWLQLPDLEETLAALPLLSSIPTLRDLASLMPKLGVELEHLRASPLTVERRKQLDDLTELALAASARAKERIETIDAIASQIQDLARMDFRFLYDTTRHLFAIGYNVDKGQRDASYYDLLASEARLPCFVAIAQGQVPQESWFALGRMLTSGGDRPILLSWSGSMFEYLMPMLVMPTYENTLLDETCLAAVERQIAYGRQLGVPWGCRSRATTPSIRISTTSTGRSAYPASD
jgi:hypothetical protein